MERKLNRFMVSIPSGVVLTSEWLEDLGVSSKLAWWYVHSGLLERVGAKAYKKAGDNIGWQGVVSALQNQLHLPLHVGGKTALQLLGRSHFVPMQGLNHITIFADSKTNIPTWLSKNELWKMKFEICKTTLFDKDVGLLGVDVRDVEGVKLLVSSPERASMELLYLFPRNQTLEEVMLLMENLGQLRPSIVQSLLEKCNSIKVKRLFLYLAEKSQHAWLSRLDVKKIDLGTGKRVIDEGGKYNSKYMLSLPDVVEK